MQQLLTIFAIVLAVACSTTTTTDISQKQIIANISTTAIDTTQVICGADQPNKYLPLLQQKRVALVANHTTTTHGVHLLDTLISQGITVTKVFAPEHGFRGDADAGQKVNNSTDPKTGVAVVSIYGKTKKPDAQMLADVDIVVFDIQDVGARFYTYISTLYYVMEACAEQHKTLLVLDRPNPNGDYVAGPVLDTKFRSFVGMLPVPIVHGCTVAELAQMINGEGWLTNKVQCNLQVVHTLHYTHSTAYSLPAKPSPNLPNDLAIRLYPSLCLFEGTNISVGRGTQMPFQIIGYPDSVFGAFSFTPQSIDGMSKYPPHQNKVCYGNDLRNESLTHTFTLSYLIDYYNKSPNKQAFFLSNNFFDKLAGNSLLRQQIQSGLSAQEIEASWQTELEAYKLMRKKYLLYEE